MCGGLRSGVLNGGKIRSLALRVYNLAGDLDFLLNNELQCDPCNKRNMEETGGLERDGQESPHPNRALRNK